MADSCPNILHFCRVRITKLDAVGAVASGSNNSYVTDNTIQAQLTPVVETGQERTLPSGCGGILASNQDPNRLKRWQIDLNLGALEPSLKAMMLGVDTVADGGDIVGINGVSQIGNDFTPALVAFEAWAEAEVDDAPDPARPWAYFVWPATNWQLGQNTLSADYWQPTLQGFSKPNPSWFTGPYDDIGVSFDVSQWAIVQVPNDPPTASCGPATVTPGT